MPKSHPHSKKGGAADAREPAGSAHPPADDEVSAEDLRRQMAILAEQVRRLGDSAAGGADVGRANVGGADAGGVDAGGVDVGQADPGRVDPGRVPFVDLPLPPLPRPRRSAREEPPAPAQPAEADEQPPATAGDPPIAVGETTADRTSRLVAGVVTLAELAAAEIRASAELEAEAIRAKSAQLSAPTTSHLLALLERQRHMLAGLAEQTDRLEQAGAVLRAQIRALDAEREHIFELLAASRRTQ